MLERRQFLWRAGGFALAPWMMPLRTRDSTPQQSAPTAEKAARDAGPVTLFLCGDVMTGRGIDQVLPHPSEPQLHESYLRSALGYVELAESANGPIPKPVDYSYVWGDALQEFESFAPDLRIVNLETSITRSDDWEAKGINYRMHPANVPCLTVAGIDCCVLANNHVLDWGKSGLLETLEVLRNAGLGVSGAGSDLVAAQAPAVMDTGSGARVIVFGFGTTSSGIPAGWAATGGRPGVCLLPDLSDTTAARIGERVRAVRRTHDIVVASIHWGGNWGYEIPPAHRGFAHRLVEEGAADIIHGHSSHHPKGIEVYQNKPILYGCGDFLNDYEGIGGYEEFRSHLTLMYFATVDPSTQGLLRLEMRPLEIKRFRLQRTAPEDARWLRDRLHREGSDLGTGVTLDAEGTLRLGWRERL